MSPDNDVQSRIDARRAELEHADAALVAALARRSRVVETIAALKADSDTTLRDPARERAVLEHVEALAEGERLDPHFLNRIFRDWPCKTLRNRVIRPWPRLPARRRRGWPGYPC